MRDTTSRQNEETALSEVIGFVLILGLIAVVASLYLTYGVPAQGRENEINHMNELKDQFVAYKLSLDSLFTNNQVGMTMSDSFTLGTPGGYTQGMMSVIPIMNPVGSGGIIAINNRTATPENLTLSSDSFIVNNTVRYSTDLPTRFNYTPSHVYVNISGIQSSDLSANGNFGATVNTTSWAAYVNLTPETSFYQWYNSVSVGTTRTCTAAMNANGTAINVFTGTIYTNAYSCLVPINTYTYNGTDITVTVKKGNLVSMQNYPVYRNIQSGTTYTIDLMDDAYGLKSSAVPPDTISIKTDKLSVSGLVTAKGNISYDFSEINPYAIQPIPLGAVEYRSQNNYWINQNYYYQAGGVFLSQIDGNTTYKLPPEITFSYNNVTDSMQRIVTVNINALTIDPSNRGVVGGNSPIQLKTGLTNITPFPYAYTPKSANTKWIQIGVDTPDSQARAMWKNYFNYTATVAGIPNFTVDQSGNQAYIRIKGNCNDDVTTNCPFDINVVASQATYSTSIHGIGGTLQ